MQTSPSLLGRVGHFVLGLLLVIPLINTIVFLILRLFAGRNDAAFSATNEASFGDSTLQQSDASPPEEKNDAALPKRETFPSEEVSNEPLLATPAIRRRLTRKERLQKIQIVNEERNNCIRELADLSESDPRRAETNKKLQRLELDAARTVWLKLEDTCSAHLRMSKTKNPELVKLDGQITYALENSMRADVKVEGLSHAEFNQVGGLTQYSGYNHLCGYYALFFMLQAVAGKDFVNREEFHPFFLKCARLIAVKRVANYFSNNRHKKIPLGLNGICIKGLNRDDMQYLIENLDMLSPLRHTPGCFLLEIDEYKENKSYSEPIKFLGKSKTENSKPDKFPIFFIVKDDLHYYFVYAKEPPKFTVVHSLNYSVFNPKYFSTETFLLIIKALNGFDSPLKLNW